MLKNTNHIFSLLIVGSLVLLAGRSNGAEMEDAHTGPMMNYHRIDDQLVTGGHLLDGGSATLKEEGVTVVINLLDEPSIEEENQFLENGIKWINVPIEWSNPKSADFDRFSAVMREQSGEHVLVQCYANYRASAMTYLYRVTVEDVSEVDARKDLDAVWDPAENEAWGQYIDDIREAND